MAGGQWQRGLVGRALSTDAEVLVLDEPKSDVDYHFGSMMIDFLREANRSATVVLVTHEEGIFEPLATRQFKVHKYVEEIPSQGGTLI